MSEPNKITAGNSYDWTVSKSDFPASSGWVVTYSLTNSVKQIDITSVASGDDHLVTLTNANTALYPVGIYDLVGFATKGSDRKIFYSKSCEIKPDPASSFDVRTYARKVLDAINDVILGKASKDTATIAIDGKSITRYPIPDLLVLKDRFQREVKSEETARKLAGSSSKGGIVKVRLG